jgi:dsDNA-specific endonuclease/ATPase MutS2
MEQAAQLDTPMHRATVAELNNEQLNETIELLRERRLKARKEYQRAKEIEEQVRAEKLEGDYEQQMRLFEKDFKTCTNALERLEKRMVKMVAIRNELGIEE